MRSPLSSLGWYLVIIGLLLFAAGFAHGQAVPPAPEIVALQKDVAELKAQVAEIKALLTTKVATADPPCPCSCGCGVTGQCSCTVKPTKADVFAPAASYTTICGPSGCQVVPAGSFATGQYYYLSGDSGASAGSCANGSCSGSGRVGIFGRRRR